MASQKTPLLCVTMLMASFFFNSPTSYASKPAPEPASKLKESYKVVTEFCNKRRSKEEQEFCMRVLKSHPNTTSAKDNPSLLLISVDLAIENVNNTREFLTTLSTNKATKASLNPVLQDCIFAYDGTIGQLGIIPQELADDPPVASYDALMAHDELIICERSLNTSKIVDGPVSSRHKIAKAYVQLCVDISMSID